jgi:hypothetical protein
MQPLVEGESPARASGKPSGIATDVTRPLGMLRSNIGAAIELGTNREKGVGAGQPVRHPHDLVGHNLLPP